MDGFHHKFSGHIVKGTDTIGVNDLPGGTIRHNPAILDQKRPGNQYELALTP
jgi:hypothetical protein